MAAKNELASFIGRDQSEFYAAYIRDQFMARKELVHSGLKQVLELEQKRTQSPAVTSVIQETFSFADDSSVSSAVKRLASLVEQAPGRVLYCPGAMLDLKGVAIALGRECTNIDTLICVSSWEFDALEVAAPSTSEFVRLIPQVLKESPFVAAVSLQSDSRDAPATETSGLHCPWRLEWRVLLRCVRRGEKKALRLIYFVNEDFTSFFSPELAEPGALAAIYAPRVHLPLWEQGFAEGLRRMGGGDALVIQDQYSMHCGAWPGSFFSPELEAAGAAAKHREEQGKVQAATEAFVRAVEAAEVLRPAGGAESVVHSLFSDPADLSVQPIRFNFLRAAPLPALQRCNEEAMAALQAIVGPRLVVRIRAEYRSFLGKQFAAVWRADAPGRPGASMTSVLRDHLAPEEDAEAESEPDWPRRGAIRGWDSAEVEVLRREVSEPLDP